MTTTTHPDVPLPAGADYVDDWQKVDGSAMPYRFIGTKDVVFADHVRVWTAAVQYADGSLDDGRIEAPGVFVSDWRIPNEKGAGVDLGFAGVSRPGRGMGNRLALVHV